jgi:Pilin (bacterial filament)
MKYWAQASVILLFIGQAAFAQSERPDLRQLLAEGRAIEPQVAEGLRSVVELESAIERTFRESGRIAVAYHALNPDDIRGTHVASIEVIGGAIVITYGREADRRIVGRTLVITPYQNLAGEIWWRCAEAQVPDGFVPLGTYAGTPVSLLRSTVSRAALPASCLSTF